MEPSSNTHVRARRSLHCTCTVAVPPSRDAHHPYGVYKSLYVSKSAPFSCEAQAFAVVHQASATQVSLRILYRPTVMTLYPVPSSVRSANSHHYIQHWLAVRASLALMMQMRFSCHTPCHFNKRASHCRFSSYPTLGCPSIVNDLKSCPQRVDYMATCVVKLRM